MKFAIKLSEADLDMALEKCGLLPPPKTTLEAIARYEARVVQLRADIEVMLGNEPLQDFQVQILVALRRDLIESELRLESFRHQHHARN